MADADRTRVPTYHDSIIVGSGQERVSNLPNYGDADSNTTAGDTDVPVMVGHFTVELSSPGAEQRISRAHTHRSSVSSLNEGDIAAENESDYRPSQDGSPAASLHPSNRSLRSSSVVSSQGRLDSGSVNSDATETHTGFLRPHPAQIVVDYQSNRQEVEPVIRGAPQEPLPEPPPVVDPNGTSARAESKRAIVEQLHTPVWLTQPVLYGFVVLFSTLLVTTILLWHFARLNNGLSTQISTNHYTWTYGPTAVLVVVVGLWRQVDYHCKSLSPWQEMQIARATAARSLLLDYVSPLQIIAFWKAIRNQHFSVLATITGFTILKLITLFSTGLLVLSPINMTNTHYPVITTTVLSHNTTYFSGYNNWNYFTTGLPVYAYYGILADNLPYPLGTNEDMVHLSIASGKPVSGNFTITAEVDAIVPTVTCDIAEVKPVGTPYASAFYQNQLLQSLRVSSSICNISSTAIDLLVRNPQSQTGPPRELVNLTQLVDCTVHSNGRNLTSQAIVLVLSNAQYTQSGSNSSIGKHEAESWSTRVTNSTGVVCQVSYSIGSVNVSNIVTSFEANTTTQVVVEGLLRNESRKIQGFNDSHFTTDIFGSFSSGLTNNENLTLLDLMSTQRGQILETFLDAEIMAPSASEVLRGIAIQLGAQRLVDPGQLALVGTLTREEGRLMVQDSSVWVIVAGLAVLICLAVVTIFTRPFRVALRYYDTIGGIVSIIRSSREVESLLIGTGASQTRNIRPRLENRLFHTVLFEDASQIQSFSVTTSVKVGGKPDNILPGDIVEAEDAPQASSSLSARLTTPQVRTRLSPETDPNKATVWRRPIPVRNPFAAFLILFPVAIIVVLEILQRLSDQRDGLMAITSNGSGRFTPEAWSRYIPALAMLLISTSFNAFDFTIATFAPFLALRKGKAPIRVLYSQSVGRMPPLALLHMIRNMYWGASLSLFASMVGSFLTVIVSGLYVNDTVTVLRPVTLSQLDYFDAAWNNSVLNDNQAAGVFGDIEQFNLTFPTFTYDELAFPNVTIENPTSDDLPIKVKVAALRGSLNCTVIDRDTVLVDMEWAEHSQFGPAMAAFITVTKAALPSNCQYGGADGHSPYMDLLLGVQVPASYTTAIGKGYAGLLADLHLVPGQNIEVNGNVAGESTAYPANPAGCPSLAFLFGYFEKHDQGDTIANVTALSCTQHLQQLTTDVTYLLPGYDIDVLNPPRPDESSMTYLENGQSGSTAFEYRIENNLASEYAHLGGEQMYDTAVAYGFDAFYRAVTVGPAGIPPAELVGPENVDRLLNATNHIYRRYMAQAINANMRRKPPVPERKRLNATLLDSSTRRLKQNSASKLALQVLLGIMVLCAGVAYAITDVAGTLPHNPSSIAGIISLLAGSRICEEETDWLGDKATKGGQAGRGKSFRLGWWEGERLDGRRFGIDYEREEGDVPHGITATED